MTEEERNNDLQRQLERAKGREPLEEIFKEELKKADEEDYQQQLQSEIEKLMKSKLSVDQILDMYNKGQITKKKMQEEMQSCKSSLQTLLRLADLFDQKGFYKIADKIDILIRK